MIWKQSVANTGGQRKQIPPSYEVMLACENLTFDNGLATVQFLRSGTPASDRFTLCGPRKFRFATPVDGMIFVSASGLSWAVIGATDPKEVVPEQGATTRAGHPLAGAVCGFNGNEGEAVATPPVVIGGKVRGAGDALRAIPLRSDGGVPALFAVPVVPEGADAPGIAAPTVYPIGVAGVDPVGGALIPLQVPTTNGGAGRMAQRVTVDGMDAADAAATVNPLLVAGYDDANALVRRLAVRTDAGADPTCALVTVPKRAVQIYDSGNVAAGALIQTGTLDVSRFSQLTAILRNPSAATTRYMEGWFVRDDATTEKIQNVAVGVNNIGFCSASRSGSGTVSITIGILKSMNWIVPAGGADIARLTVWGNP